MVLSDYSVTWQNVYFTKILSETAVNSTLFFSWKMFWWSLLHIRRGYKILFLLPCLIRRKLKMTTGCPIKIIRLLRRKLIITDIFLGNLLIFKDRTNFIPDLYCFVFNQDSCGAKCLNWMFYKGFHSKCDIAGLVMMMIFKQR